VAHNIHLIRKYTIFVDGFESCNSISIVRRMQVNITVTPVKQVRYFEVHWSAIVADINKLRTFLAHVTWW
jgi:hypothetical protein